MEGRETRVMFFSEWRVEGRSERSVPTRSQRSQAIIPSANRTVQKSDTDMQTTSRHSETAASSHSPALGQTPAS